MKEILNELNISSKTYMTIDAFLPQKVVPLIYIQLKNTLGYVY